MFLIRNEQGEIYNKVSEPAVVVDLAVNTVLKIGEYSDMEDYFNFIVDRYNTAGFPEMAHDLAVMNIPKDQEEIDRIFLNSGYIEKYTKEFVNKG